jgi:hypothetical protein
LFEIPLSFFFPPFFFCAISFFFLFFFICTDFHAHIKNQCFWFCVNILLNLTLWSKCFTQKSIKPL